MATQSSSASIDQLIISSPYEEPKEHWKYDRETRRFTREPGGRRSAGYIRASDASKSFDDPGEFVELPLVNKIRPRVDKWRSEDYPGANGITKRLLKHWRDPEQRESKRFFFCQLEAIETLMWVAEAPESERVGNVLPTRQPPRLASSRNRSTSSLLNKDATEIEPCKIRGTTQPLGSRTGLEGKEISSPSGRGRKMSLTSLLIEQAIAHFDAGHCQRWRFINN